MEKSKRSARSSLGTIIKNISFQNYFYERIMVIFPSEFHFTIADGIDSVKSS